MASEPSDAPGRTPDPAGGGALQGALDAAVSAQAWREARENAEATRALEVRLVASDRALASSEDKRAELEWTIQELRAQLSDIQQSRAYSLARRIGSARGRLRS